MKNSWIFLIFAILVFFSYFVVSDDESIYNKNVYSIDNLSLDEKIGQMLFIEYRSNAYTSEFYNSIYKYKPGGFILYSENLGDYKEYFELIRKLNLSSDVPIFIGIDQEGGNVWRLSSLGKIRLTKVKSLEEIGKRDLDYVFNSGRVISEELSTFGINVNFSPVLDIATTGGDDFTSSRSFSTDKDKVAKYGEKYIMGLNNSFVVSCAKHLPGIGDGTTDTHFGRSYIHKTSEELEAKELVPFKSVSNLLDMMMLSHDIIPSITGDFPLTLSKDGIDYLKNYLEYDGLIVSDGLRMRALTDYYSTEEILIGSINAGVDILLAPEKMDTTVEIIKKAVLEGKISLNRINEAVVKILQVKERLKKSNYTMNDFFKTYHNLLLKYRKGDNYTLIDEYIFESRDSFS